MHHSDRAQETHQETIKTYLLADRTKVIAKTGELKTHSRFELKEITRGAKALVIADATRAYYNGPNRQGGTDEAIEAAD